MNYLSDLLTHLEPQELELLETLPLTVKERQVTDLLLSRPDLTREEAIETLGVSGSHYDKLCSSTLGKCYDRFTPSSGIERLDFLKLKGLWAHLEHEFKKLEKQLTEDEKPMFYYTALRHLALYTYDKRYVKLVEKCMERAFLYDPSPAMTARIEALKLHIMVYTGYSQDPTAEAHEKLYQKARDHRPVAEATGDALAMVYQLNAEAQCRMLEFEGDLATILLEESLSIIDRNPELFLPLERMRVLACLAESFYYDDKLVEASVRYHELFSGPPITLHSPHYHAVKFAQILTGLERVNEAELLLQRWFPLTIFKPTDRRSATGAINLAKVYLTKGDAEKARQYLQLGYQANIRAEIIPFEFQLRTLEALSYLITGEYDIALEILEKVIRYARDKEIFPSVNLLPPVFAATNYLIRSRADMKPLDPEFDQLLANMTRETKHAEVMLRRLRELTDNGILRKTQMAA